MLAMGFKDDIRCSRYADADVTSDSVNAATTICAGEADVLADTTDALASSGKLVLIPPQKLLLLLVLLPLCCWCCCLLPPHLRRRSRQPCCCFGAALPRFAQVNFQLPKWLVTPHANTAATEQQFVQQQLRRREERPTHRIRTRKTKQPRVLRLGFCDLTKRYL